MHQNAHKNDMNETCSTILTKLPLSSTTQFLLTWKKEETKDTFELKAKSTTEKLLKRDENKKPTLVLLESGQDMTLLIDDRQCTGLDGRRQATQITMTRGSNCAINLEWLDNE